MLFLMSLVATGIAGVSFEVHPGYPAPNYFSGTNARAFARAYVTGPTLHIDRAILQLNGETVVDDEYDIIGTPPHELYTNETTLMVMFDSSHWISGTTVTVTMWVLAGNVWYTTSYSGPCRNKIMMYDFPFDGDPTGSHGAQIVHDAMYDSNYSRSWVGPSEWTFEDFFNDMTNASCVYVNTHGAPDLHEAATDETGVSPTDYLNHRTTAMGTGYPPFNSTSNPPISLLMLNSCLSGVTNSFNTALYPWRSAYQWQIEDQALLAWRVRVLIENAEFFSDALFSALTDGHVADNARNIAIQKMQDEGLKIKEDCGGDVWKDRAPVPEDLHVWGDFNMRLKTVYTGDGSTLVSPVWYRRIYSL